MNEHSRESQEPAPAAIKAQAIRGTASLLARQLIVRVLGFAATLALARILTPEIFGVFAIVLFAMSLLEQLSSLGLGAALLRKRESPTLCELRTVFTVQQVLVAILVGAALVAAAPVVRYFDLPSAHAWLIRAGALGLVLASWKTLPTILLERRLRHDLIATAETIEFFAYQSVALVLAVRGLGIWALVFAVLSRASVGMLTLHLMCRWRPGLAFDRRAFAEVLRFGVPIQLASFAGLVMNAVIPILVGSVLGVAAVGHANFARSIADALLFQPLILLGRVQFRVFASLQDEVRRLRRAVERSMYIGVVLVFPAAALIVCLANALVEHLVTGKWSAALPVLYALVPAYLLYTIAQPLMQTAKALGDAHTPLHGMVLQSAIQVAVFLSCYRWLGLPAYALAVACGLAAASVLAYRRVVRRVPIALAQVLRGPAVAAAAATLCGLAVDRAVEAPAATLLVATCCLGVYALVLGILDGRRLGKELSEVVASLLPDSRFAHDSMRRVAGVLVGLHGLRERLGAAGAGGK